jgi:hypothetical protein
MTKSEFIRILKDPSLMSKEHTFDLEDVVSDFPFFQAARVLYLKGLKSQNSFRYNQSLKTTAVYTNERSVLFAFISSNDYNLPTQQKNEQAFINEIGIQDQQVLDQIYKKDTDNTITELPTLENEAELHSKLEELFGANQIISPDQASKVQTEEEIFQELFHKETPETDSNEIEQQDIESTSDFFKQPSSNPFPNSETPTELEQTDVDSVVETPKETFDFKFTPEADVTSKSKLSLEKIQEEEAIFFELFHKKETPQTDDHVTSEDNSDFFKANLSHRFPGDEELTSEIEEKTVQKDDFFSSDSPSTDTTINSDIKIKEEEAIFFELFHKNPNPEIEKEAEPASDFFKEHSSHTFPVSEVEKESEIDEIADAFLHKLEAEHQTGFVENESHIHKSIFSEDTESKPEVFKDPFFPSHEEQQENFLKSQTSHTEIENVKDIFNIDVTKEIVSDEIDEIADAFLKQFEAENTPVKIPLEKPYEDFDSVLQKEYADSEVKDAEDLKIPVFLSYDEKETTVDPTEVDEQKDSVENEPEIEITEEPVFNIATKVETPIEVIEDTVDFQSQDEFTFELLPKEIFEETILDEPIVEKLEVTLSEEFCPPVQFNQNDTHSFSDWLKISSFKPIDRNTEPVKKASLEEKLDLIEEFIVKNPKIEPIKEKTIEESTKPQITENEEIMTETLARVYVLQHKYADAISAYQILSLKFPEKSSFFADQIKQIEVLRRNNF